MTGFTGKERKKGQKTAQKQGGNRTRKNNTKKENQTYLLCSKFGYIFNLDFSSPRRERDSNPRYLSVRRFSRPVQSTTLPSLLKVRPQGFEPWTH